MACHDWPPLPHLLRGVPIAILHLSATRSRSHRLRLRISGLRVTSQAVFRKVETPPPLSTHTVLIEVPARPVPVRHGVSRSLVRKPPVSQLSAPLDRTEDEHADDENGNTTESADDPDDSVLPRIVTRSTDGRGVRAARRTRRSARARVLNEVERERGVDMLGEGVVGIRGARVECRTLS